MTNKLFTIYDSRTLHLPVEPSLRQAPVALDGGGADAEHFRGLLDGDPAEEAQLDESALFGIDLGELFERLVERDQLRRALVRDVNVFVEGELGERAAALLRLSAARVIDEDAAHHLRGDAEEVRAVLPAHLRLIDHPDVSLAAERR